jgi:hypothetical protein
MTLAPEEFLRRFLQHVLPLSPHPLFGLLANRRRARLLPLFALPGSSRRDFFRRTAHHAMEVPALPWVHASRRTALSRTTLLRSTKGEEHLLDSS